MNVARGTRLGPYEIEASIGAGGMGEVFRARDTRLERSVAIKILPAEFAQDAQLKIRLAREAKTISQLNHPHICSLFDIGHDNGTDYLVMEYIEGESLADRVLKGPLPLDQVLRHGIEIADALDKAHRKGIVHRDLKPGNIMITKSGSKLLDFGLAKVSQGSIGTGSATQQKPLTSEGAIVGTFQYMAPEQLEGLEADARTDIFAFGAVLYEMATGRRAFEGKSKTSLIAAIVSGEPKPISQLQPLTPPALERTIRKCLNKDPDERWQCAADLRSELLRIQEEIATGRDKGAPLRGSKMAWAVAAAALLASAVLAMLAFRPREAARPIRLSLNTPSGWTFYLHYTLGPPAVSPDGRYVVVPAAERDTGRVALWIRDLEKTEPFLLPGTEGAGFPFWSPDSRSVAFFAGGYLKRVDLGGGTQILAPITWGRGGTWSRRNEILFAPEVNGPLYLIPATGGTPRLVTRLDVARRDASHRFPYFLPDGKHFLFLGRRPWTAEELGDAIYLGSVDSPDTKPVFNVSSNVAYAEPGYLLFVRDRTFLAQRFNLRTFQLEGEPFTLSGEAMQYHPAGFALFSSSREGVLAFSAGSYQSTLKWLDRQGHAVPAIEKTGDFTTPRLTADQQQILHSLSDPATGGQDLWLYDIQRRVSRRVTAHPRDEMFGVLTPDGRRVIFSSNRDGFPSLYVKSLDGEEEKLLLSASPYAIFSEAVSPDGRVVLYRRISSSRQNDIFMMPVDGGKSTPFLTSPFNETQPTFSSSGRWVAFTSNESGRDEVYAVRFPDGKSQVQISTEGGTQPVWRGDEKELFYLAPGDQLMSIPIDTSSGTLKPGAPKFIAEVTLRPSRQEGREYDVSRDGRRILVNEVPPERRSLPITVVLNWQTDLPRK